MSAPAMSGAPAAPAAPKPRPYRRYLTSALHTRFVHAVLLALFNSFFIAFWTGGDYFWSWFPIGPAGIKAALFSMTSLFIFILQLATLNIGRRISPSVLVSVRTLLFDISTYQSLFWYIVSAWWFCEAYIWSVPESHNMGWVIRGKISEPDRLNERPIYLRFFFTVIAVVQSVLHLSYGQSYLHIPIVSASASQPADSQVYSVESTQIQLQKKLPVVGMRSLLASGVATVIAPFVYKALFRDSFWQMHLAFAKPFFNLPRTDARPPQTYFIGSIIGWAFVVGMALTFTWELAAHSFLIYVRQAPLKNGLPLSAGSQDPNGTLLNGLTAKRSVVKTFAFWELSLIAQRYPDRRKAIFTDFERPNGAMWTLMLRAALSVVSGVDARLTALDPSPPQPAQTQDTTQITVLPRIARDVSSKPVLAAPAPPSTKTQVVENFIGQANKALGQSSNPWSPPIKRTQQKLLEYAKPAIGNGNNVQQGFTRTLKTGPVGGFFGTNVARKISGLILGAPAGNAAIIAEAVDAVTKMLVASLNEDGFGKAMPTVPEAVKQFTKSVTMIENYIHANLPSPTVDDEKELNEVIVIVSRMKAGLRELLGAFQVYLNDAGLSIKDLNEARRASEERRLIQVAPNSSPVDSKPEMEESRPRQQRQVGQKDIDRSEDDPKERRTRETAQSLRRIESQPRKQRLASGDRNVFGARDFSSVPSRHAREVEMVR